MFKDPLLVKGSNGMTLTARANELYVPLQNILTEVSQIITPPTFKPSEMEGEIVIATRDYEMHSLLPDVIKRVRTEAPRLALRIVPLTGDDLSPLERNEFDFVVSGTDRTSATLVRQMLIQDNFICLVCKDNPAAKQELTFEKYLAMKHCMITINDLKPGIVDTVLAQQGLKRQIGVRVPPYFLAASALVSGSDLIVTIPRRLGLQLAKQKLLVTRELPMKVPSFTIYLYWHIRNQNNPIHSWIRKKMQEEIKTDVQ
jgi:DNA-binding transcriptional LysR family regulator